MCEVPRRGVQQIPILHIVTGSVLLFYLQNIAHLVMRVCQTQHCMSVLTACAMAQGWAERPVFGKIRYMNYNGGRPSSHAGSVHILQGSQLLVMLHMRAPTLLVTALYTVTSYPI